MDFKILHNGVNIEDEIEVVECFSIDRYGGMLDDLTISFVENSNAAAFNKDDTLEIGTVAGFTTGTMYLDSCVGKNGLFTVKALSCRHDNKKRKSKIWHRVKLSKIIADVAANTGLSAVLYGVKDYSYNSVAQIMETDLQMLARICKREGYSIKCDNGNLIVFNEYDLENNSEPITISKDGVGSNYSFNRSINGLSSVTVRYFDTESLQTISFTSVDDMITGGEDVRIEPLTDTNEAMRVSAGYLRDANKFYITGVLTMPYNSNISAGTVCDLTGFEDFDGRYVVYEAKHDFLREKTIIKVRYVPGY